MLGADLGIRCVLARPFCAQTCLSAPRALNQTERRLRRLSPRFTMGLRLLHSCCTTRTATVQLQLYELVQLSLT
jgi:hypothetical protein